MTQAQRPFVARHALRDVAGWREDLAHVADLRDILHGQGVSAATLRNLLDYEIRLARFLAQRNSHLSTLMP